MAKSWKKVTLEEDGAEIWALKQRLDKQMLVLNICAAIAGILFFIALMVWG